MVKFSMECKKMMAQEISSRFNEKPSVIVTSFKGLIAKDLDALRKDLRGVSGEYIVVKDSIVKHALAESPNKSVLELIEGEVGIALDANEDATYISKVLVKFSKDHKALEIRGGIMGGAIISKEDIKVLAALPSKEVLLGKLANVLNAPIQGLAASLNQIIAKLAYVLNALKDKKPEPKIEPKPEVKVEAAPEVKEEPKVEVKPEEKPDTQNKEE